MPILGIDIEAKFAQVTEALTQIGRKTDSTARQMQGAFNGVKSVLGTLGVGLSIVGIAKFAQATLESVAALDDLSEKSALSVETLSKLQEVTRIGGTSLESAAEVASKFAVKVSLAAGGNKELIARFQQLGVSVDDLKSKGFDELFIKFATSIATATDKENALAVAVQLSSRAAAESLPFFNDLAEKGLGVAKVTAEQAAQAEKAQKQFRELVRVAGELQQAFAIQLLPTLLEIGKAMQTAAKQGEGFFAILKAGFKALTNTDDANVFNRQIVEETDRLLKLEKTLESLDAAGGGTGGQLALKNLRDQIELSKTKLKELQNLVKVTENPVDAPSGPPPKTKPGLTVGAIKDSSGADKEAALRKAAAEATIRLEEARAKTALDIAKAEADGKLAILEKQHSLELVGDKEFFAQREAIQKTAFDAEIAASSRLVAIRLKEFEKPAKDATQADRINNLRDLEAAVRDHEKLIESRTQTEKLQTLEATAIEKAYKEEIVQVTLALDELRGKTVEVAGARFDLANKSTVRQATERGDTGALQKIKDLRAQTVAQVEFSEGQRRSGEIVTRLGLEEERIARSRQAGAISEFESLRRIDEARNRALLPLQKELDALKRIASESQNPALILAAEQAENQLEELAATADLVGDKIKGIFSDSFSEEVKEVIRGTKSIKDAFFDMVDKISSKLLDLALDDISAQIFGKDGPFKDVSGKIAELFGDLTGKSKVKGVSPGEQAINDSFESQARAGKVFGSVGADPTAVASAAAGTSLQTLAAQSAAAGTSVTTLGTSVTLSDATFVTLNSALTEANVQVFALSASAQAAATALASVATSASIPDIGGGGGFSFSNFIPGSTSDPFGAFGNIFGLKAGGIMTAHGLLPLHKFAGGGIAKGPMLSLFGEGRMNEAYVPLPDGRRIPVVQTGGKQGDITVVNQFTINGPTDARSQSQIAAAAYTGAQGGLRNL